MKCKFEISKAFFSGKEFVWINMTMSWKLFKRKNILAVVRRCSRKKGVLKNFAKFTGKHLCLGPVILFKKRLWHRCFPVNFAKFERTPFLLSTFGGCFWKYWFQLKYLSPTVTQEIYYYEKLKNVPTHFHSNNHQSMHHQSKDTLRIKSNN